MTENLSFGNCMFFRWLVMQLQLNNKVCLVHNWKDGMHRSWKNIWPSPLERHSLPSISPKSLSTTSARLLMPNSIGMYTIENHHCTANWVDQLCQWLSFIIVVVVIFIVTTTLMPISIVSETWAGSNPALQITNRFKTSLRRKLA